MIDLSYPKMSLQVLMILNFNLVPVSSPTETILALLKRMSEDIGALDTARIPAIKACLAKDYVASDDLVTKIGVDAGVVPANYETLPDCMKEIIGKCNKLEFKFSDPQVKYTGDKATVEMMFEVHAETKPKPPDPAMRLDIVIGGRLDLRKEGSDWKITFWQLLPPFVKFVNQPL